MRIVLMAAVCATVVGFWELELARAQELEREFVRKAPELVKALQQRGIKTVGVLKFRVQKGIEPVSDNVGTLNGFLADRLELALILANDNDERTQLQIIKNAGATAADIAGANHATPSGREKLFGGRYLLAWGNPPPRVAPDGFVTGVVKVSPDLRDMTVGIMAFDRKSNKLELLIPVFTAPVDATTLNEMGENFVLRGAFNGGQVTLTTARTEAVKEADKVKSGKGAHPLQDPQSPITLDVTYDNQPVAIRFRNGQAEIPEPNEGQKVVLSIKRTGKSAARLAVVLKVNGENSLFRQRVRDADCSKWILEPDATTIAVRGFQKNDDQIEQFRILSKDDSRRAEVDYGNDVGLISIVAFREKPKDEKPPVDLPSEEDEDLKAMQAGAHPKDPPKNSDALKTQLRNPNFVTKGLIRGGDLAEGKVKDVKFETDPTPVFSAILRYYQP
jgi:hypothetical protein